MMRKNIGAKVVWKSRDCGSLDQLLPLIYDIRKEDALYHIDIAHHLIFRYCLASPKTFAL